MKLDPQIVAKLKAEHPGAELTQLASKGNIIVVKSPSDGAWGAFLDAKEKVATRAYKQLLFDCLVWPSADELTSLLDRKPGLANVFGPKLMELAGVEEEATAKKL